MTNNYSIIVLLLIILIVVTIVYLRKTEQLENFQENVENGLSKVNIERLLAGLNDTWPQYLQGSLEEVFFLDQMDHLGPDA